MCSGVTAFTVTKIASTSAASDVGHAMNMLPNLHYSASTRAKKNMNMLPKVLCWWNQVRMAFREVLSNRASGCPHVQ